MAVFQWKGIQNNRLSSGEVEAPSSELASKMLMDQSIIATNIILISGIDTSAPQTTRKTKIPNKRKVAIRDLMIFTKKFATMVEAGLSILKTLKMLEDQVTNPYFKWVVKDIYSAVESGSTLSDAFGKHPTLFDPVYINLLRAGEMSGRLTLFLKRLVSQIEKSEKIRAKVKGALMYPSILVCVAIAVIAIMLVKVVPVFQTMFASMGNNLPGPTQLIVTVSEFARDPMRGGLLVLTVAIAFILLKLALKNSKEAQYKFDHFMLKIPLLGEVIEKSILAKIAMLEGNLGAAGVPVLEAFDIIARATKNLVYKNALGVVKRGVSSGEKLSVLYENSVVFPVAFSQLVAVGEETGNMDEMFEAAARYYEEEFDMTVDRMTELLEPIMIVFMGLTVGFIIVAMYMPIFQIGKTIQ